MGRTWTTTQNSTTCHWFQQNKGKVLAGPSPSPDLHVIEPLWENLKVGRSSNTVQEFIGTGGFLTEKLFDLPFRDKKELHPKRPQDTSSCYKCKRCQYRHYGLPLALTITLRYLPLSFLTCPSMYLKTLTFYFP